MKAATQRRLTPALAVIVALLAALLGALWLGLGRGVHWDAPHAAAPLPSSARAAALPPPTPLQRYAAVWQKPLFNPDRQPVVRAAAGDAVGDLALTGIILTRDVRMALVHDRANQRDLQIVQGRSTPDGSWTLREVRARSAVFDAPGGRVELKLPDGAAFDKAPPAAGRDAREPASDDAGPSDSAQRMGVAPGRAQRPRRSQAELQAERIRQLNAVIQKRRAEQADSTPQGVR